MGHYMIKIYGNEMCSFCLRAKRLADSYGLDYTWHDVDEPDIKEELLSKISSYKTIPQIFWHDRHIGGYEQFASEIENTAGGFGDGKL
jgi:glutaredoxin 3